MDTAVIWASTNVNFQQCGSSLEGECFTHNEVIFYTFFDTFLYICVHFCTSVYIYPDYEDEG